jgi:predicted transcriptional regulator
MREITSFSLDEDVVRRLNRLASHLDLSRSRCLERILQLKLPPLPEDPPPPSREGADR